MNYQQITALANLQSALRIATDCGALDILLSDCNSPDSINDVCDSIPKSLNGITEETPFQDLLLLWKKLGNVPTGNEGENVEQIEEDFLHFPIGTHREVIWHWFEKRNSRFVVGKAMSGELLPKTVFHGTSVEQWNNQSNTNKWQPDLYVTEYIDVAASYAKEWGDGHKPMIVGFQITQLLEHFLELIPNQETLQQIDEGLWGEKFKLDKEITWFDTLKLNGTFAIRNFPEELKSLAVVVDSSF